MKKLNLDELNDFEVYEILLDAYGENTALGLVNDELCEMGLRKKIREAMEAIIKDEHLDEIEDHSSLTNEERNK